MLRSTFKLCNKYKRQFPSENMCRHLRNLKQGCQIRAKRDASVDQRRQVYIDLKSQSSRDDRAVLVAAGSDSLKLGEPAKNTQLGSQ